MFSISTLYTVHYARARHAHICMRMRQNLLSFSALLGLFGLTIVTPLAVATPDTSTTAANNAFIGPPYTPAVKHQTTSRATPVTSHFVNNLAGSSAYDPETELVIALETFLRGEVDLALQQTETIVNKEPTFRLAQLVYGDLLNIKGGQPASTLATQPGQRGGMHEKTLALLDEARIRWRSHFTKPELQLIPKPLVQMPASQRYAVVVDIENSRLYIAENQNGIGRIIKSFYASIGKNGANKRVEGDSRTPVGVYQVTDWLEPDTLPDLYGTGAFPINYPNSWDRRQKRTGSGIWLHGVPSNTYSRPPRSSRGCVALTNRNFDAIKPYIRPGQTQVVLAEKLEWITAQQAQEQRASFRSLIESWRQDWESLKTARYLSHYAADFTYNGLNLTAFSAHKQRVNQAKTWVKVEIADLSILHYPGEQLFVTTFTQKYRSNNFSGVKRKQQYWQQNARGQWKILREENLD